MVKPCAEVQVAPLPAGSLLQDVMQGNVIVHP